MSHSNQDLKILQAQFQACLIENDQDIESSIQSSPHFNAQARMAVYINSYYSRLVEVLGKSFPILKLFCGEDKFDEVAFAYLDSHPSQDYSLYQFGKYFSEFLRSYFSGEPIIAELAAFERALYEVLLAGNAKRIGVQALLELAPEQWPTMKLSLHPAVQTLELTLNVVDIWRALNTQQTLPAVAVAPSCYLIWRFHQQAYFRALTSIEMRILNSIQVGDCFAEVCEGLMGHLAEEEIGGFVAAILQQWLRDGIFIDVR